MERVRHDWDREIEGKTQIRRDSSGSIVGDESLQTSCLWCPVYILWGGILNGPSFLYRFINPLEFHCS